MTYCSTRRLAFAVLGTMLVAPAVLAQPPVLRKSVAASGGTDAADGGVRLRGTVGQAAAGRVGDGDTGVGQGFWGGAASSAPSVATLVVNSAADPGDGICNAAECTLREAITASNASTGRDVIHFAIPGGGLKTITPLTPLPAVTSPVEIDGYSQPGARANTRAVGNDAVLRIELNGNGAAFEGLVLTAGASAVRGLVIDQFNGNGRGYGITLQTGGGTTIAGNWIGVDPTGTMDRANSRGGIYLLNSAGDTIGGTAPADRNVIVGEGNTAIYDEGTGGGHTIQGNYVGTNAAGTMALARGGIWLVSSGTLIGGTAPGARNVLSTVAVSGIAFREEGASSNTVQGNYIGVTADGTAALAPSNGLYGIYVLRAGGNLVGGTTAAARNVIASINGAIYLSGSPTNGAGNTIQGNYLGTDAAGTAVLPAGGSAGAAVRIEGAGNTVVGGTAPGAGNVLAGSSTGVIFYGSLPGNVVQGNFIGTNAAGTAALPNNEGILFAGFGSDDGNLIGGTTAPARNVISGNAGDGIRYGRGDENVIQGNYIGVAADGTTPLRNGGHGIEIGQGSRNRIGGTEPGAGNVIANNGVPLGGVHYGVVVFNGTSNAIEGNAVYGNLGVAINLYSSGGDPGATPNDPGDADDGPNRLQNTPVLDAVAIHPGTLTVTYRVDTAPANATYPLRVEVFRAFNGEGGAALLGTDDYTAADYAGCGSAPCPKAVSVPLAAPLAASDGVTATATDADGNTSEFTALIVPPVGVEDAAAPAVTALLAPAPNPSGGATRLRYALATAGPVRLALFDALGREVAVVVDGERSAGDHSEALDASALATGVYVVRFEAGDSVQTRRFVVVR